MITHEELEEDAGFTEHVDVSAIFIARAAADTGRSDEALRLEQRLSESAEPEIALRFTPMH